MIERWQSIYADPGVSFRLRLLVATSFLIFNSQFLIGVAIAQVPNDDIEKRRVLQAEEKVTSSTTDCTVQWACVDEQLTGKCIEYHNDQWFEFTPKAAGRYYVNIGGQQCRDTRGVQLVVLTGEPCQPATYQILSCTSLGNQDDVFVVLDSLKAGQRYLMNVDGYLRDYCRFEMAVSQKPKGLPAAGALATETAPVTNQVVALEWTLEEGSTATRSRIWRREAREMHSTAIGQVPVQRSVYGSTQDHYTFTDTLQTPGRYYYQVVAEAAEPTPPVVVSSRSLVWLGATDQKKEELLQRLLVRNPEAAAHRSSQMSLKNDRRSHRSRMKKLATSRK